MRLPQTELQPGDRLEHGSQLWQALIIGPPNSMRFNLPWVLAYIWSNDHSLGGLAHVGLSSSWKRLPGLTKSEVSVLRLNNLITAKAYDIYLKNVNETD